MPDQPLTSGASNPVDDESISGMMARRIAARAAEHPAYVIDDNRPWPEPLTAEDLRSDDELARRILERKQLT